MKTFHIYACVVLFLLAVSCKDDDVRPLSASSGGSSFDELNMCDIGSGAMATVFDFQIELTAPPTIPLGGVEFDLEWSDGDTSDDIFENDLDISGSTVEFDWCFRFGSTDWFEIKATIVDDDRKPLSNSVTIRVNKPAGAN